MKNRNNESVRSVTCGTNKYYMEMVSSGKVGRGISISQVNAESNTAHVMVVPEADFLEWLTALNELGDEMGIESVSQVKSYKLEDKRLEHPKAYLPWTADDDEKLKKLSESKVPIKELARIFERNEGAIKSRIAKL